MGGFGMNVPEHEREEREERTTMLELVVFRDVDGEAKDESSLFRIEVPEGDNYAAIAAVKGWCERVLGDEAPGRTV